METTTFWFTMKVPDSALLKKTYIAAYVDRPWGHRPWGNPLFTSIFDVFFIKNHDFADFGARALSPSFWA